MDARDHREHVDDWLRGEAWNGCTADVVERDEDVAEGGTNSLGFASERVRPAGIVFGDRISLFGSLPLLIDLRAAV